MKKKWKFREIYLVFLAVTLIIYGGYTTFVNTEVEDYESWIFNSSEDITKTEEIKKKPLVYKAYKDNSESDFYYVTFTEAVGYQSNIEVMTVIDSDMAISDVKVINHGETPAFFNKIEDFKFTKKFVGKSVVDPIYVDRAKGYPGSSEGIDTLNKVDAVGGATISSVAIANAVNTGTSFVSTNYFDKGVSSPFYEMSVGKSEILLLVIYLIALMSVFYKGINKHRKFILLYSVFVVGFYLNKFVTFGMLQSLFIGNLPMMNNMVWYMLVFGTLGLIILSGKNMYCMWICPFGAAQEVILKFGGLKQIKLNPKLVKKFTLIPPTLAYLAIMIMLYTNEVQTLAYDPFGAIFNLTALPIMWMSLPILIFISLFQYRFYCTYFCPIGFVFGALTKLRNKGAELWKKQKKAA